MNIQQENTLHEAFQTKWELINKLTKDLSDAMARVAYTEDKIKTGRSYIGDLTADNAAAKARVKSIQKTLNSVLNIES